MLIDHRARLKQITDFASLVGYLRDEMDWPIDGDRLQDLSFDYTPEELGIEPGSAAKILEIKRLRPLSVGQPWGIFFVRFEPKRLPVVALRRILSRVVLKKRASANSAERTAWEAEDLLFVSNFGEGDDRQICFAHFTLDEQKTDLPILKVLGWNDLDTPLRLDHVAERLTDWLAWPEDDKNVELWRERWRSAFTERHREVITTSKLLAQRLAELARAIRNRINTVLSVETEDGPLTKLMKAFREALVHDLDADGFADMYAQTIAYGLLSARIADPKAATADDFAAHMRTNPFLQELMETFLHVGGRRKTGNGVGLDFDELGVSEVVALLDAAKMEAVLRDFGDRKPEEDPVIHFYELFLKEYDARKRTQRGVFYTPLPVVSYIVRSVHELLQTEFGLPDGLADTATWGDMAERHPGLTLPEGVKPTDRFVTVLDPATGTGTFLVEAIEVIHRTLVDRWKREGHGGKKILDLWNEYVPTHLLPRLHGYELMMAPYAIAHVKIGLKLHETGYRFGSEERARIYLTNSLEPAHDFSETFAFAIPALAHEADAVNAVKRDQRFTVVVGNPPYARHSSNPNRDDHGRLTFIGQLVEEYKEGCPELRKPAQAKYLQDDYVKFLRLAEFHMVQASRGIIGIITNHGFLDNPTLRGMRKHILARLSKVNVIDLHGNANKKERAPDGSEDMNVFDIKQGVAILIGTRLDDEVKCSTCHTDLWGSRVSKYRWLAGPNGTQGRRTAVISKPPQFYLRPSDDSYEEEYVSFPSVREVFSPNGDPAPGIVTTHDSFAVAFTENEIICNVETLLASQSEQEARRHFKLCSQSQWNYEKAKRELADGIWRDKIIPLYYRPLDIRFTVYDSNVAVHRRERVTKHLVEGGNLALLTSRMTKGETFRHAQVTRFVPEVICMSPKTSNNGFVFPLWLKSDRTQRCQSKLFDLGRRLNLGRPFLDELCARLRLKPEGALGVPKGLSPEDIFHYIYSVFHSTGYRRRYTEFLKIDFPRVPLTSNPELFRELAGLGRDLVTLHLIEAPPQRALSANYDETATAWRYEAATGQSLPVPLAFRGPENPVVAKVGWSDGTVWIDAVKPKRSAAVTGTVGFRGVPEEVWNFHIGGYQVCEKWLKDRRGRTLTADDITHYHRIVIALHETIRIMREIDQVIDAHGGWPRAFQPASAAQSEVTEAPPEEQEPVSVQSARMRSKQ